MFDKQICTIRTDSSTIQYAIISYDSDYLNNTTVEIENFSAPSATAFKEILVQLQHTLHLKRGDLMFSKIPPIDYLKIQLLHRVGFYYIEQAITLDIDLSTWRPNDFVFKNNNAYQLIPAEASDKKSIREIARMTFNADRFHLDQHIPKVRADHRFEMWIENSYHSSDAIYKFIDQKKTIIGFFIIHEYPKYTDLRLAGLHPAYVGRGLGKMLYHHMFRILKEKKHNAIKCVISLNNIRVLNVYTYLTHAKFSNPLIVLHKVV